MTSFRISTLLAATAAFAILCLFVTLPHIAGGVLFTLLLVVVVYGLTAPANGTTLDVSTRPGVQFMVRLWAMSAVLIMFLMIACMLSTDLRRAVDRARFRQWQRTPTITEPPSIVYGLDG